jgi:thiol-disulfide isomerase/thioredoxin
MFPRFLPIYLCSLLMALSTMGQNDMSVNKRTIPKVGEPCPDFQFSHVLNFSKSNVSNMDFRGKWLFLDFWFSGCGACVKSFPKINALHAQHKNKATFLLVGKNDWLNRSAEPVYNKLRAKQNLQMPAAFDSLLSDKWDIYYMPCIVIVDPAGVVRYVVGGADLTSEKVEAIVEGQHVFLNPSDNTVDRPRFNPGLLDTNSSKSGKGALLYRSIITKWNGERQNSGIAFPSFAAQYEQYKYVGWTASMVPLYVLYNFAYIGYGHWLCNDTSLYGKYLVHPIVQVKDPGLFDYDYKFAFGKGTYNCNLVLPANFVNPTELMKVLQRELKNVFGFEVRIENRLAPVWKLIRLPGARDHLRSKGGEVFCTDGSTAAGFTVRNFPVKHFLGLVEGYLKDERQIPFIDETGLNCTIDITLDGDMTNLDSVRQELQKNGLDLVVGSREMSTIVIFEPEESE